MVRHALNGLTMPLRTITDIRGSTNGVSLKHINPDEVQLLYSFPTFFSVTGALRESLLFDFGASLMARDSLWLFGIDYLEHSSVEGGFRFKFLPFETFTKIELNCRCWCNRTIAT